MRGWPWPSLPASRTSTLLLVLPAPRREATARPAASEIESSELWDRRGTGKRASVRTCASSDDDVVKAGRGEGGRNSGRVRAEVEHDGLDSENGEAVDGEREEAHRASG